MTEKVAKTLTSEANRQAEKGIKEGDEVFMVTGAELDSVNDQIKKLQQQVTMWKNRRGIVGVNLPVTGSGGTGSSGSQVPANGSFQGPQHQ